MASFSNKDMREVVKDKPHIALIIGYWRVSPIGKGGWRDGKRRKRWDKAHEWANQQNAELHTSRMLRQRFGE